MVQLYSPVLLLVAKLSSLAFRVLCLPGRSQGSSSRAGKEGCLYVCSCYRETSVAVAGMCGFSYLSRGDHGAQSTLVQDHPSELSLYENMPQRLPFLRKGAFLLALPAGLFIKVDSAAVLTRHHAVPISAQASTLFLLQKCAYVSVQAEPLCIRSCRRPCPPSIPVAAASCRTGFGRHAMSSPPPGQVPTRRPPAVPVPSSKCAAGCLDRCSTCTAGAPLSRLCASAGSAQDYCTGCLAKAAADAGAVRG